MYKNFVLITVYSQLFCIYLNFGSFGVPNISNPVVQKPDINIFDYCELVQIETKNFYEGQKTLGQGSFGAVKEIDENYVVKIQEIPIDVDNNKNSQKNASLSSKSQLDDEIYFLNVVKEKLKEQNINQTLQDKFLILQKCEIFISEEENKYYYYQILLKYQADLEYKYDKNFNPISIKGLHIVNYMRKTEIPRLVSLRYVQMAIDLFQQLEFLHNNNLVHGDIKADNILVKSPISLDQIKEDTYGPNFYDDTYELTFTLGDYGLTRYQYEEIKLINLSSTHPAMQMSIRTKKYAVRQSDIYSMAITILTVVQYQEQQRDVLYYRDILYESIYQDLSKYNIDDLDQTFKQTFYNLKQKVRQEINLQQQTNMSDCNSLGCVLYFSFALNMMNQIPKASKILKYLYKINNYINFEISIQFQQQQFEFENTFSQIQDLVDQRCQGQTGIMIELKNQIDVYQLSENCNASQSLEAFKFKQNILSEMPENTTEQLFAITSKENFSNWIDALTFYNNNVGELQNFLNYDYYSQMDVKESKVLFGLGGTNIDRQVYLYTFFQFDFTQSFNKKIPKQIEIDDQSRITYNLMNLFDGLQIFQNKLLVFQNINPYNIVQTTYFQTLKDLNLRMIASPIYKANLPLLKDNYQLFFTYPLNNYQYYNYQADTYSMSLTCIYIIFKIYYTGQRRKIDEKLLEYLDTQENNRLGKIQTIRKNIEFVFKLIFQYDLKRTQNCLSINQFPENLICVLMKQIVDTVDQIEEIPAIKDQIEQIHTQLTNNGIRRAIRIQLIYNIIFLVLNQNLSQIILSKQKLFFLIK